MATRKTKTEEKKYIVVYEDTEAWVIGNKQDIINDFDESPETYIDQADKIKIYELGDPIPFSFITPQIVL
jgi:hypothetical protein